MHEVSLGTPQFLLYASVSFGVFFFLFFNPRCLFFWLLGFLASWLLGFLAFWLLGFLFFFFCGFTRLCGFWWLFWLRLSQLLPQVALWLLQHFVTFLALASRILSITSCSPASVFIFMFMYAMYVIYVIDVCMAVCMHLLEHHGGNPPLPPLLCKLCAESTHSLLNVRFFEYHGRRGAPPPTNPPNQPPRCLLFTAINAPLLESSLFKTSRGAAVEEYMHPWLNLQLMYVCMSACTSSKAAAPPPPQPPPPLFGIHAYIHTYLPTNLHTYIHILPAYLPTCLPAYLVTWLPGYLVTWLPHYLPACLPACLPAPKCLPERN